MSADDLDLSGLFAAPQIHTDEHGTHRDDQGREYRLVDIDGEATFIPVAETAP